MHATSNDRAEKKSQSIVTLQCDKKDLSNIRGAQKPGFASWEIKQ